MTWSTGAIIVWTNRFTSDELLHSQQSISVHLLCTVRSAEICLCTIQASGATCAQEKSRHTNLLVVWPRSSDPDGDVAVAELFCVLLERRNDASESCRDVREVGYAPPDDEDLSINTRST